MKTISPSTEEVLSQIAISNQTDVNKAVKAAQSGFETWSKLSPYERSKYLFKIARLIQERSREFAVLESLDAAADDELLEDKSALAIASRGISSSSQSAKFSDIKLVSKLPFTNSSLDITSFKNG